MGLREDVKFQVEQDWHPKVPRTETIMQQAKSSLRHGKSSGDIKLDTIVMQKENQRGDDER